MTNSLSKPSAALIAEWPEIFETLEIEAIPVMYLDKVTVKFITGMVWEVDVKNYLETLDAEKIEGMLQELYEEYKDEIKAFEYDFDIEALKRDIHKLSNNLL